MRKIIDEGDAQKLFALEQRLSDPDIRSNPEALAEILHDDFQEIGASGRYFSKMDIIRLLKSEKEYEAYVIEDFQAIYISDDVIQIVYRIPARVSPGGEAYAGSLRSSLWLYTGNKWQIIFHQGTKVSK